MDCCTATGTRHPVETATTFSRLLGLEPEGLALRGPRNRQWLEKLFHFEIVGLPTIQDRFDNVGRKERKWENLADVGAMN